MTEPSEENKVGYKSPPIDKRFGAPDGNKPGMTSAARKATIEAGEKAALLYLDMVNDLEGKIGAMRTDADAPEKFAALMAIKSDILRLLKDVQDRAFGTAVQQVDNTSSDGSQAPSVIRIVAAPMPKDGQA